MGEISDLAHTAFRDYSTDGVPSSGKHSPRKADIRDLFDVIDDEMATVDTFEAKGEYSGATTYSRRDVVIDQGASWVYVNGTPGSGHAPPTLPTLSNSYWVAIALPGTDGSASSSSTVEFTGDLTPSQITSDKDDYNPSSLSGATVLRHDLDADRSINGLQGGSDGRLMIHANITTAAALKKNAQRASSTAAYRFAGVDLEIDPGMAGIDIYDSTSSRWRPCAYRMRPRHLECTPDPWPTVAHKPTVFANWATMQWLDPRLVHTRASVGARANRKGTIVIEPSGVPRFHTFFSSGESGLRTEGSRTNIQIRSQEFNHSDWGKTRASITANAAVAPDGTLTADKLVEDTTASNSHLVADTHTLAASTVYLLSVFAKAAERTHINIQTSNNANWAAAVDATFNLLTGTVTSGTGTIEAFPDGWYRCSIKATFGGSAAVGGINIRLHNGTSFNYNGDGASGVYVWGAQIEAGDFPSSYIPTTSSTVTRAADTIIRGNADDFINAAEGTLYWEGIVPLTATGVTQTLVSLDDGTTGERIAIQISGTTLQFVVTDGSVDQCVISLGTYTAGNKIKVAARYNANDFHAAVGGTLAGSPDTSGTLPTVTQLQVGRSGTSEYAFAVHAKAGYFPRALTNAQLQAITS